MLANTITFRCPFCGANYEKAIDSAVRRADIVMQCTSPEGCCGELMRIYILDGRITQVHSVSSPSGR